LLIIKFSLNTKALIIAAVISGLAIGPTLLMDQTVKAAPGKSLTCDTSKHSKDYCDRFTVGKTDCRDGKRYNASGHTKNWVDAYKAGWTGAGCHVP
jgi:hypothetical protein